MKITIQNLCKSFGSLKVLEDINLQVQDGEFLCVTGPSGCGKTTLLRIVAGLESYMGEVLVDDKPVKSAGPDRFIIFQQFNQLLPWKTVYENIEFGLLLNGKKDHKAIMNMISLVGLNGFENVYPHQLSGGMGQRVALARALILNPSVLLMDEPFGSLDARMKKKLQIELLNIWKKMGKTIFFVTHSIRESLVLADRILVLTKRPGHQKALVNINLSRPRDQSTLDFGSYWQKVTDLIET